MAKHRPASRARRYLLLFSMVATAIAFLAPAAQAAQTVITVTKTASPAEGSFVSSGDRITYTILIQNGAGDIASGLTLTDALPANTTYVAGSASISDGTAIDAATYPFASLAIQNIDPNESTTAIFQVDVNPGLAFGTTSISNTATVSASNADPASDLSDDAVHTIPPQLNIDKTADPLEGTPVIPGEEIEYTIEVENDATSTSDATGVKVTDVTPTNTTYVANSATEDGTQISGAANPFDAPGGYTLTDSTLAPGESHTLTFRVLVDTPLPNNTVISNTATVEATNGEGPESDTADHTVASMPGLTVTKTADPVEGELVVPGTTITYTMVAANDPLATETATGVELTDLTPAKTKFLADSAVVDGVAIAGSTNPFASGYPLPDMAPGDSITMEFTVTVDNPLDDETIITNTATVDSDQGGNSDTVTHEVDSAPILTMIKTAAPAEGTKVTPGTTIPYTIEIANGPTATETAKELVLTDPTPANTNYVEGSAKVNLATVPGQGNPFAAGYSLLDLLPGTAHTVTFSVKVVSPLATGTVISNLARLTGENHDDLQDGATHTVDSAPVLKLQVDTAPKEGTKLEAGDPITYTIRVENDPAATDQLNDVKVTAPTPEGTSFLEGSAKLDGQKVSGPVSSAESRLLAPGANPFAGTYTLGTMAPGASHTLSYRVAVKPNSGRIVNVITVTALNFAATSETVTHRGPNAESDDETDGGGGGGGLGGSGTIDGGVVSGTGEDLAFTGLDLVRLLLLAFTLLLAGATLLARGRALQRRMATGRTEEPLPSTGSQTVDRWVDSWFYPQKK